MGLKEKTHQIQPKHNLRKATHFSMIPTYHSSKERYFNLYSSLFVLNTTYDEDFLFREAIVAMLQNFKTTRHVLNGFYFFSFPNQALSSCIWRF